MAIVCDPSLLLTKRGTVWVHRATSRGCLELYAPASILAQLGVWDPPVLDAWLKGGLFGHRQRAVDLGRGQLRPLYVPLGEAPPGSSELAMAEILVGLNNGMIGVGRRSSTFNLLLATGFTLSVTGRRAESAWVERLARCLDGELLDALLRRVRFLYALPVGESGGGVMEVCDRGPNASR